MPYLFRRYIETGITLSVAGSLTYGLWLFIKLYVTYIFHLAPTAWMYTAAFMAGALLFFGVQWGLLNTHFFAVGDVGAYLRVNVFVAVTVFFAGLIAERFLSPFLYTIFFSFSRTFRYLKLPSRAWGLALGVAVFLILVLLVPYFAPVRSGASIFAEMEAKTEIAESGRTPKESAQK